MSGPASAAPAGLDLAEDPGVLADLPLLEFQGWRSAQRRGGAAVLPWRGAHLRARAEAPGLSVLDLPVDLPEGHFTQALVRIQKGRAATMADLAVAWGALAPQGSLLVAGHNDLGITGWAKRLATQLGQPAEVLANRAHGRVVRFRRDAAALPMPEVLAVPADAEEAAAGRASLNAWPGVFSRDGLDAGTALLQSCLVGLPWVPLAVDLGCGAGQLALHALRHGVAGYALLLDADARAVRSADRNLASLGLASRGHTLWWDAFEPAPALAADLVLLNPPCHAGAANDLAIARQLFSVGFAMLAPGGRLLVVANRQLPYEANLGLLGPVESLREGGGFKVLELRRR
jgi:16S rRNA (guanine1207-N2)-methyltransferase